MSTKIDTTTVETQRAQTGPSTSPSISTTPIKLTMFKKKPGFVIPKNKFSGSLVPIFKGGKKSEANDGVNEESTKQLQRKTKWGLDLTQDTSVKKGRALAYQTRVDQITQLLKSGTLGSQSQSMEFLESEHPNIKVEFKDLQTLELERREAIGEILKLNPNYKAPSDYQPVVREALVPIPVKSHPDYNFLGLVYGSDGETQKRLEKETGTRIQVCGTKSKTKEKVEITTSDGSELIRSCEDVHVRITSDTWEKVDAATSLIELLLSSVKPATSTSETGENKVDLSGGQDIATSNANNSSMPNQEQPGVGPVTSSSSQGLFQTFLSSWLPAGHSNPPTSMSFSFNPSLSRPLIGPGHPAPFSAVPTPRLHTPTPVMPGSFIPSPYPSGQTGPLRNLSPAPSPIVGHNQTLAGSPRIPLPQLTERPITSSTPSGWVVPPARAPQSLPSSQFPPPQLRPGSTTSIVGPQIRSSSPVPAQGDPQAQAALIQRLIATANNALRPSQNPLPPPSSTSFTPLIQSRGPSRPPSGDFTFSPSRPQAPVPWTPGQGPSFRPALQNTLLQPIRQNFPGNQIGTRPGQFGPPNMNSSHTGPRPIGDGPFPPRGGHPTQFNQNYRAPPLSFVSNPRPRPQVYDPFSPTSISGVQPRGSNIGIVSKQETDAEYEDLMASVGVK